MMMSQKIKKSDQHQCLIQILTCLICQKRAVQAHICPNCSKFYCYQCIQHWILQKEQKCPYCTQTLCQNQLINCTKLYQELSSVLEKGSKKKHRKKSISKLKPFQRKNSSQQVQEAIVKDQLKQLSYIQQIEQGTCQHAVELQNNNSTLNDYIQDFHLISSHKLPQNDTYQDHLGRMKKQAFQLRTQLNDTIKLAQSIANKKNIHLSTDEHYQRFESLAKNVITNILNFIQLKNRLNRKYNQKIAAIQKNIQNCQHDVISKASQIHSKHLEQNQLLSKVKFLQKETQIKQALQKQKQLYFSQDSPFQNSANQQIKQVFQKWPQSDVQPVLEKKIFYFSKKDFQKRINSGKTIRSASFPSKGGLQWQISICPNIESSAKLKPSFLKSENFLLDSRSLLNEGGIMFSPARSPVMSPLNSPRCRQSITQTQINIFDYAEELLDQSSSSKNNQEQNSFMSRNESQQNIVENSSSEPSQQQFLSIYIELIKTERTVSIKKGYYRYRVSLGLKNIKKDKNASSNEQTNNLKLLDQTACDTLDYTFLCRQYSSEFQKGDSWGWQEYMKKLHFKNQIQKAKASPSEQEDYIAILLQIGWQNYYEASLDQNQVYRNKLLKSKKNQEKIKRLKVQIELKKEEHNKRNKRLLDDY